MNDARRMMDRFQEGSLNNDVKRLREQAAELSRRQEQIKSDIEKLAGTSQDLNQNGNPSGQSERPGDVARRVVSEKNELKKGLQELEQGLHDAARKAAGQQKNNGSRDLQSTANYLKDEGLPRRIDQAREAMRRGMVDNARQREESIQESLGGLNERMANADRSLQESGPRPGSPQERLEDALNRTGDLVSDLEAMQRRAREQQQQGRQQGDQRGQQAQRGQQGQQGEPGQQGQRDEQGQSGQDGKDQPEGQQAQRGQEGQQAQRGQEGQEGQQGEQGQQGQQGQGQSGQQAGQQPGRNQAGSNQGQPGNGQQYAGGPSGGRDAVNFGERAPAGGNVRLTPDQVRQFEKEFQLRFREGQELARQLKDRPDLAAQVQDILKRMKNMPPSRMLEDAAELARLQNSVIEGFRDLELKLSRELNQAARKDNVRLAKDEDVPKEYRKQVEDYYRALAESPGE